MQYDLNQLSDPKRFQRLVNAILMARFGEDARLTPLDGADGGSDGETATANPFLEFRYEITSEHSNHPLVESPRPGRYLFQVKYHRTGEKRLSDIRSVVTREFKNALTVEVLNRSDRQDVNYFFLVTNISASKDSIRKVDEVRTDLLKSKQYLHADVWWAERITAALDWAPELWPTFPELFHGGVPPILGMATTEQAEGLSRTLSLATAHQYARDSQVKFRQIDLEKRLLDLFVDLEIGQIYDTGDNSRVPHSRFITRSTRDLILSDGDFFLAHAVHDSVLHLLLDDTRAIPRILLEGGPGQGKSTITQMAAQIYREKFLDTRESEAREPHWHRISQLRIPIRVELRDFANWISQHSEGTFEQYIALSLGRDSGGVTVLPEDIHRLLHHSSVILLLDGLDEIGNDSLRDQVLDAALAAIDRFENALNADVRIVLTTRPPAVLGRWSKLKGFIRVVLAPMNAQRIDDYLERWLQAKNPTPADMHRIRNSFNSRRHDAHVEALARNPMQLSVLLQFISLKGEAFPDRRAELYRDYFQIVIDRDVEKSPELRTHREVVEGLHCYLGFLLHGFAEAEKGRRALNRNEIVQLAGQWIEGQGHSRNLANKFFALGEERFGLIVALSGEGYETSYGFEVQPIQEYFAAAYISNRLTNGRAHDVFQTLIYRDYWREVALFLAGLRRPNEKADLVARAKQADSVAVDYSQQNGRAIVLQLLREGVLSQPLHLQLEAMRYVIGFLKTSTLRLQRNPHELIDALSELVRMYGTSEIHAKIVEIVRKASQTTDHGLVSLMHRMAGRALPREQYMQLVLEYSGTEPETRGLVRISRPTKVSGVIEELGSNHTYWEGIPPLVIARRLWSSVMREGNVPEIVYPFGTHLHLILQFAFGYPHLVRDADKIIVLHGPSVQAIWKLYLNIQLIRVWPSDDHESAKFYDTHVKKNEERNILWSNGREDSLPGDVEECIRTLMARSDTFISALHGRRKKNRRDAFFAYLEAIHECLEKPGVVPWLAARCATELFRSAPLETRDFGPSDLSDSIVEILQEMYRFPDIRSPRGRYFVERLGLGMPLVIRLNPGGKFQPLHRAIADFVLGEIDEEDRKNFGCLQGFPLPPMVVNPLIRLCREEMESVLRFIGSRTVPVERLYYYERRVRVQDTHRILKIARGTDDQDVLRGVAAVLINATFARLAEPTLVRKILKASPSSPLVARVFSPHDGIRGREEEPELRELAKKVATIIVDDPEAHPFTVVNKSAVFLSEVNVRRNVPLFEENPELQKSNQAR